MTTCSQLLHFILISAPTRVISQRLAFLPVDLIVQACDFSSQQNFQLDTYYSPFLFRLYHKRGEPGSTSFT